MFDETLFRLTFHLDKLFLSYIPLYSIRTSTYNQQLYVKLLVKDQYEQFITYSMRLVIQKSSFPIFLEIYDSISTRISI